MLKSIQEKITNVYDSFVSSIKRNKARYIKRGIILAIALISLQFLKNNISIFLPLSMGIILTIFTFFAKRTSLDVFGVHDIGFFASIMTGYLYGALHGMCIIRQRWEGK